MASIALVSYVLYYYKNILSPELSINILIALSIIIPLLMVSKFVYPASPKIDKNLLKKHYMWVISIIVVIISVILSKGYSIFIISAVYIISGMFYTIFKMIFKKKKIRT